LAKVRRYRRNPTVDMVEMDLGNVHP
jgi:hypothetical protein